MQRESNSIKFRLIEVYRHLLLVVFILTMLVIFVSCTTGSKSTPNNQPINQPPSPGTQNSVSTVGLKLVTDGLVSPVGIVPSPDNSGRLFIVDQIGVIKILMQDGTIADQPFLDLRSRMVELNPGYDERGLLGFAFHRDYSQNGRFFVYYSALLRSGGPTGWNHTSHISEFRVMAGNPDKADETSERVVLQVDEPQANHNGGQIRFGPDGYLYIPLGDGGGANDVGLGHSPIGNGQDINTLLGKILRIDVDSGQPYAIPPDNPFVGRDGVDEIYALGLRNPFQISFDIGGTHELFAGDAGQNLWEEVDIITKGGNYGWNIREGKACFDPDSPNKSPQQCPDKDASGNQLIDPIISYGHSGSGITGTAVIGGFVYRGKAIPGLQEVYIFGDFSSPGSGGDGRLFVASLQSSSNQWDFKELGINTNSNGRLGALLRSFGQDAEGEVYVLTAETGGPSGKTGKIYRIVP